jgi:hypothetical protein
MVHLLGPAISEQLTVHQVLRMPSTTPCSRRRFAQRFA